MTLILTVIFGCIERNSSGLEIKTVIFIYPDEFNQFGIDTIYIAPKDTATLNVAYLDFPPGFPVIKWQVGNAKILNLEPIEGPEGIQTSARVIAIGDSGDVSTVTVEDTENNGKKTITVNVLKWIRTPSKYKYLGTFGNNLYFLSNEPAIWSNASLNSIEEGGHLVTISSQAENDFVSTAAAMVDTCIWMNVFVPSNPSGGSVAFAPTEWDNGEPFDYTNWATGFPKSILNELQYEGLAMNRYGKWENKIIVAYRYVLEIEWEGE
jgi:hypothetical protein